jgi:hypothetical protein
MPTLEEAANAFARDIMTMNFAGLMMAFTPEGMMKAMAIQGQMLAQAQASGQQIPQALPGQMPGTLPGQMPGTLPGQMPGQIPAQALPTNCEVVVGDAEGEDYPVSLSFSGLSGTGLFKTTWREIDGVWKVNDMAIVSLTPAEGTDSRE